MSIQTDIQTYICTYILTIQNINPRKKQTNNSREFEHDMQEKIYQSELSI